MATGVTPINTEKRNTVAISITYEGKQSESAILQSASPDYIQAHPSPTDTPPLNKLYFGDNLDALLHLLHTGYAGTVTLIYIDPPFASAADYVSRDQTLAYSDVLCGGEYVEFLRSRLIVMRELLADNGSIYLHLDNKMTFTMKLILDEVFGSNNFRACITRKKCSTKNYTKNTYGNVSDYILFYSKSNVYTWNRAYAPWDDGKMKEQYPCMEPDGRRYKKVPVHAPGVRNGETGKPWRDKLPPPGKHWQYTPEKLDQLDAKGEIYWSPTGNPRRKVYFDPSKGIPIQDIWLDHRDSINQSQKTTGYPTEKNYDMLKQIIQASSNEEDLVLDCFAGSGTTLAAANELHRQWIGMDYSKESLQATLKRLRNDLDVYGDYVNTDTAEQLTLKTCAPPHPSFSIYTTQAHMPWLEEILQP